MTTDALINWLVPLENVEQYSSYVDSITFSNNVESMRDRFICNCTTHHIGSRCEYALPEEFLTVKEAFEFQLSRAAERHNEIQACLVDGVPCNAGLLCLEWRQICDGIINCENGVDEIDCHLLEFYECASNEFQCRNGMCIPLEFLFDGLVDCTDTSDEQEMLNLAMFSRQCPETSALECDERVCSKK